MRVRNLGVAEELGAEGAIRGYPAESREKSREVVEATRAGAKWEVPRSLGEPLKGDVGPQLLPTLFRFIVMR